MEAPDVRVAGDDGSNIVRAAAIVGVGIDHDGTVTARDRQPGARAGSGGRRARAMVFTRFWLYWKFVLVS